MKYKENIIIELWQNSLTGRWTICFQWADRSTDF